MKPTDENDVTARLLPSQEPERAMVPLSPVNVLWWIRDHQPIGLNDIASAWGVGESESSETDNLLHAQEISTILMVLRLHGLVTVEDGRFTCTALVSSIQQALGISLKELGTWDTGCLHVRPIFGLPDKQRKSFDVFVLMPFSIDLLPVFGGVKEVAAELGLTAGRADDFFSSKAVMADIWSGICSARAVVADCSGRNPNVFYEIGIAHTLGKPVILQTKDFNDIPFDLRHMRTIVYQHQGGMGLYKTSLLKTMKETIALASSPTVTGKDRRTTHIARSDGDEQAARQTLATLEGTWRLIYLERDGKRASSESVKRIRVTIDGETHSVFTDGQPSMPSSFD